MAADEIHVGDIGTSFERTIKDGSTVVDVSGATTKEIKIKASGGSTKTFAASFKTDGIDGVITYVTVADDLDVKGLWEIQAHVVLSSGDWNSDIGTFEVHENI